MLGVFVLFQIFFLFALNVLDIADQARKNLRTQRDLWKNRPEDQPRKGDKDNGEAWERVINLPVVGPSIEEWVDKEKESVLNQKIDRWSRIASWWARRSGQEQGWSLFAPDTVDWTSVVRVQVRWDDDVEEVNRETKNLSVVALAGGTAANLLDQTPRDVPPPRFIPGFNEPRNIEGYFRWGGFRWRRYESKYEMAYLKHDEPEETYRARWEKRTREKVFGEEDRGEQYEIAAYLKWKFDRFRKDHPELPPPRQVILLAAAYAIPAPDKAPTPWRWRFEAQEPVVRWRPGRFEPKPENLELYQHTERRFVNKNAKPWLNPMPRSSD
jgi:hypothetical protein